MPRCRIPILIAAGFLSRLPRDKLGVERLNRSNRLMLIGNTLKRDSNPRSLSRTTRSLSRKGRSRRDRTGQRGRADKDPIGDVPAANEGYPFLDAVHRAVELSPRGVRNHSPQFQRTFIVFTALTARNTPQGVRTSDFLPSPRYLFFRQRAPMRNGRGSGIRIRSRERISGAKSDLQKRICAEQ